MRTIILGRGARIQHDPDEPITGDVEIRVSQHPDTRPDECQLIIEAPGAELTRGGRTLVSEPAKSLSARGEPVRLTRCEGLTAELRYTPREVAR